MFTGRTVAVAKTDSPIVYGHFCLPTPAFDNDGDPYILEHLIFMGSEDYPYKEALDFLADSCLAKKPSSWIRKDHTCYTVDTVGTAGFTQILPIFLDHILFPTLRPEDFVTEVHHIDGKGYDIGVVYRKIERSNHIDGKGHDAVYIKIQRLNSLKQLETALLEKVYPDSSGYYTLARGKLENIRNTSNIEKAREYHKKYYRPENLQLTVTGGIDEQQLFYAIRSIEEKIVNKRANQPVEEYIRPWSQDLKETGYEENYVFELVYPEWYEDVTHVIVSWRLEQHIWEKVPMLEAYELLLKYLIESEGSPFQKEFVQPEGSLAYRVEYYIYKFKTPSVAIMFSYVTTERSKEIIPRMEKVVRQVLQDGPEKFDLDRIHNFIDEGLKNKCIPRGQRNIKEIESGPHMFFHDATLLDKLYGQTAENFEEYVVASQCHWSSALRDYDAQYWLGLMNEIFNKHKYIAVEGIPSLSLYQNNTYTENQRKEKQIESLGDEGLAQKAQKLKAAVESQTLPGVEILKKIPFLGGDNQIKFRHLESFNRTHNPDNIIDFSSIPIKVHIDDVKSNIVVFYIFIDIVQYNLTEEQRKYLPLLTYLWDSSPMIKNGSITDIDDVNERYNNVLIKFEMRRTHSYLVMEGQSDIGHLEEAIDFVHDRINYPYFNKDDLNETVTGIKKYYDTRPPEAYWITYNLLDEIYFNNDTLDRFWYDLPQKAFFTKLYMKIESGKAESIIESLYDLVHVLGVSKNSFLYIAGNVQKMTQQYGRNLSVFSKT